MCHLLEQVAVSDQQNKQVFQLQLFERKKKLLFIFSNSNLYYTLAFLGDGEESQREGEHSITRVYR